MYRAVIAYANEGIAPSFSNVTLKAFFTLFRSTIDEQRSSAEKQSVINRDNAKGKKSSAKKKDSLKSSTSSTKTTTLNADSTDDSEPLLFADVVSDSQQFASPKSEPLQLEAIEAIYPKLGSYRDESLSLWSLLSEEERKRAIDYVPVYLSLHPYSPDQLFLNRYLKAQPWVK